MMSTPYASPYVAPRHRAAVTPDKIPTAATCKRDCFGRWTSSVSCPRHMPAAYADAYARHATDSIGPIVSASGRHAGPIGGAR